MLAFNFDQPPQPGFAGFAIQCTAPDGSQLYLKNRLSFGGQITADTTPGQRHAMLTDSNLAPYQKFRWVDFSSSRGPGQYKYTVSAMYRKPDGSLEARATADASMALGPYQSGNLQVGFTRGFLSSQAYVDQFKNAPIRPAQKSIGYDTAPFAKQWEWLGFHASKLVFDFLSNCLADKDSTLDMFAYDLDHPQVIQTLVSFGKRLRAVLDNAPLHSKPGAMEIEAKQALLASAGAENIKIGHFQRFSHDKVFVQKKNGVPVRVLTGSANWSVRGLYVQANNVLVFDDAETAGQYEAAFEQSFSDMPGFAASELAEGWIDMSQRPGLPKFAVAFSPHKSADVSLNRVAEAIKNAKSSVLFAIMELSGAGPVISEVKSLAAANTNIFSYGVTQSLAGMSLYKPGATGGILTPFAYLAKNVPPPFNAETSGGAGQVIHDKFVVVDFDTDTPAVFTGSSNLSAGGEEENGDNLLAISDPAVASIYAVQALGLVDHFHFRAVMQTATQAAPLTLDATDNWWQEYYQDGTLKARERALFCSATPASVAPALRRAASGGGD
jgi:phosphatidylserine/phosphatidylglycerophosphate/cardiolipin synthase-like enzyme